MSNLRSRSATESRKDDVSTEPLSARSSENDSGSTATSNPTPSLRKLERTTTYGKLTELYPDTFWDRFVDALMFWLLLYIFVAIVSIAWHDWAS